MTKCKTSEVALKAKATPTAKKDKWTGTDQSRTKYLELLDALLHCLMRIHARRFGSDQDYGRTG